MFTTVLTFLSNVLVITGSLGAIYSGWSWWRQRRREKALDQPVTIRLCEKDSGLPFHTLGIRPARRTIVRSEVMGLVGMVRGQPRFACAYTASQEFIDQVARVFDGDSDVLDLFFTEPEKSAFQRPTEHPTP